MITPHDGGLPNSVLPESVARLIGIFTTDTDLVIKSWDTALERMTGIPADQARGRRLDDLVPALRTGVVLNLLREPLVSGAAQVFAPALHKFLIPCAPLEPSEVFDRMQQRVVVGALRDNDRAVGLVVSIEDVTMRLERERKLAQQLRDPDPAIRAAAVRLLAKTEPTDGLGPLGSAIADDDWQVRRSAVRALAGRRDAALVDAIVTALRDGHRDFSLLSSAMQLLALTDVDVTDALSGLLRSPEKALRVQAALALGTQPRPEAVLALLEALDDPDANVQFHAVEALGKLGAPAAIDRLARIAESGDFFLAFPAIESLVRINDPLVAPRLAPLLGNPMLAEPAAGALGALGTEAAIGPLLKTLDDPEAPARPLVSAMANIHRRYMTLFGDATEIEDRVRKDVSQAAVQRILQEMGTATGHILRDLVVVVGWLRDPAIPPALARLLGSADVRHEAVEAMVRFGAGAVERLIEQLNNDDLDLARSAVVALGRIGDSRAVPALIAILDSDRRELWTAAAAALGRLGDSRAFEQLLVLLADRDAAIRQSAIGALNSIGHPAMGLRIRDMLEAQSALVRESAVKIAGYFGYGDCAEAVLARCSDDNESVRAAALEHLPYFDDPGVLPALDDALRHGTARARAAAAQALGCMPSAQARPILLGAVDDDEPWVRYFAAMSLGRLGDAAALKELGTLAHADPAPHVAVAAIEALGAIGGDEALRILEPLVASDAGERGDAAIRVLGGVRSPRCVEVLQRVLRSPDVSRRAAAVEALAACGESGAVQALEWTAVTDGDAGVARAALAGLAAKSKQPAPTGRLAVQGLVGCLREKAREADALAALARLSPAAIPWLAEALDDDNGQTRRSVVEALGRLTHPSASAYLLRAMSDGDAAVRRQAVYALSRIGTLGLAQRLSALSQHDPSPAVREAAAVALKREVAGSGGHE